MMLNFVVVFLEAIYLQACNKLKGYQCNVKLYGLMGIQT